MTIADSLNGCSRSDVVSLRQSCDVSFCDDLPVPFVVIKHELPVYRYLFRWWVGRWSSRLRVLMHVSYQGRISSTIPLPLPSTEHLCKSLVPSGYFLNFNLFQI